MGLISALAFITGVAAHLLRRPLDRLPRGVSLLASYAVGVIIIFPFASEFFERLKGIENTRHRFSVSYLLGAGFMGAGVICHYLLEGILSSGETAEA